MKLMNCALILELNEILSDWFMLWKKTPEVLSVRLKKHKYLIDDELHSVKRFGTNHIERKNLTLRTHLKRLNRRTTVSVKVQ